MSEKRNIIIVSDGNRTCICYNGKIYAEGITEVLFQHEAGEYANLRFVADVLPIVEDALWEKSDFEQFLENMLKSE